MQQGNTVTQSTSLGTAKTGTVTTNPISYTNDFSGAFDGSWQGGDEAISINNGRAELVASGTAGSTYAQAYFDLGTTLSDNFVVRWTEGRSVQSSSAYNSHHSVGLTDTLPTGGGGSGGQLSSQNGDWLGYRWYYGTQNGSWYGVEPRMDNTNWGGHDNTSNTRLQTCAIGNNSGNGVPKVDDVYYHEMKMVGGSEYTYTLYGDEGYTTVCSSATISSSGITATNPSNPGSWYTGDPSDLQYFVMATNRDSAKGVWTHWFDDLQICDGQTDWANCTATTTQSKPTYFIGTQPDSATNPLAIIDELHVHSAPAETVVAKSHDRGDAEFNLVDTVPFATEGATITYSAVSYTHLTLPTIYSV